MEIIFLKIQLVFWQKYMLLQTRNLQFLTAPRIIFVKEIWKKVNIYYWLKLSFSLNAQT